MGHYILVEKDSKLMQKCWKWIIISTLVVILITCFLSSYAFQATLNNFNSNCISEAKLSFKKIQSPNFIRSENELQNTEFYNRKINETFDEFQTAYMSNEMKLQLASVAESDQAKKQIFQMWRSEPVNYYQTATERSNIASQLIPLNDSDFFRNEQIDEIRTKWGNNESCSNYYYYPVIEVTMAVIWIVLVMISGRRGEQRADMFIHKSWRLVVPAVVCFVIFAILCMIYAAFLNNRLNDFCQEFKQKFTNDHLTCSLLVNRFSMNDNTLFEPASNFNLAKYIGYFRIFLWLLAGFIMLLRCILGADFEVEEIEHCTNQNGSAFDAENDAPARVKFIDDGIQRYERESVYKPTTEMQRLK